MDRLLTFEGRQPIWLDDIDFLQDSFAGEIARLIEGLVPADSIPDVVILKGCVESNVANKKTYTDGIIYCKGEILRVEASSIPYMSKPVVKIYQETDPAGNRILQDTEESVSCYVRRSAAIAAMALGSTNQIDFSRAIRLSDLIDQKYSKPEEVLYDGDGQNDDSPSHFKLVRNGSSFTLLGNFRGFALTFVLKVINEDAARLLGNSHDLGEDWNTGVSFGVAGIYTKDDSNSEKYICAPVHVYAEPAQDYSYTELTVRVITPNGTTTNWSNGVLEVRGGFTMNLNTI